MTPADIVKVLTAAAPIAATVASIAKTENKERKDTPQETCNVSIIINNYFYTSNQSDAMNIANKIQNQLLGITDSGTRYTL